MICDTTQANMNKHTNSFKHKLKHIVQCLSLIAMGWQITILDIWKISKLDIL